MVRQHSKFFNSSSVRRFPVQIGPIAGCHVAWKQPVLDGYYFDLNDHFPAVLLTKVKGGIFTQLQTVLFVFLGRILAACRLGRFELACLDCGQFLGPVSDV